MEDWEEMGEWNGMTVPKILTAIIVIKVKYRNIKKYLCMYII